MKTKLSVIAASLACATMVMLPTAARADAVAQSHLSVDNLRVQAVGDNGLTDFNSVATAIGVRNHASVSTSLDGADPTARTHPGSSLPLMVTQGAGGYSPNNYLTNGTGANYTGAYANIAGDIRTAQGASAVLDTTVNLPTEGFGQSTGSAGVTAGFQFTLDTSRAFQFDLDASQYLIAHLGTLGLTSNATNSLQMTISRAGANTSPVFQWTVGDSIQGGTVLASPFSLNNNVVMAFAEGDALGPNNNPGSPVTGSFSARTDVLAARDEAGRAITYSFDITQLSQANATVPIPEPSSVVLLGIGLLGIGFSKRGRQLARDMMSGRSAA